MPSSGVSEDSDNVLREREREREGERERERERVYLKGIRENVTPSGFHMHVHLDVQTYI